MADTPVHAGPIPVLFTGAWQDRDYAAGLAGGIDTTVRSALHAPIAPAAFVTAASFAELPATGAMGVAYKTLDNGKRWRWAGFGYVEVKRLDGTSYS